MATSYKTLITYNLDAVTREFDIPYQYLARKFIVVSLLSSSGGEPLVLTMGTDYRFVSKTRISLTRAWGTNDGYNLIELRRVTSATDRIVDFSDGSILRAYDLNTAQMQSLHVAEEGREQTLDVAKYWAEEAAKSAVSADGSAKHADEVADYIDGVLANAGDKTTLLALDSEDPTKGDYLVTVKQPFNGSKKRQQHDKNAEFVTLFDFGSVKGDGISDDSAGIAVIEALASAPVIYGLGETFKVSTIPTQKKYCDGWWLLPDGTRIAFDYTSRFMANHKVIAIGPRAGMNINGARNCIAIGEDAMTTNVYARHNIAIGISALHYVNGVVGGGFEGTRNIGIGGNAGRFLSTGNRNILMGRDTAHALTIGVMNIVIGNAAMMGDNPNTLDPTVIENQTPLSGSYNIIIGTEGGRQFNGANAVGIGHNVMQNVKTDTGMVGIGAYAFAAHQSDMSYWGTKQSVVNVSCTYVQTTSKTITITANAHGLSSGFRVWLRFLDGAHGATTYNDDNWFVITVVDANKFTIESPVVAAASGNAVYTRVATTTLYNTPTGGCVGIGREVGNGTSNYRSTAIGDRAGAKGLGVENVAIGYQVHFSNVAGAGNVGIGAYSQTKLTATASGNVSVGTLTLTNLTTGLSNTVAGAQAMRMATTGSDNVALGGNALRGLTTGNHCTAVGGDALRYTQAGVDHNFTNATGIGYQAYVSGDNQVQLGNSDTMTYVYGTVQNRSDARDKADVRETTLGLEFIKGLRAVDGRWDYRSDYTETVTKTRKVKVVKEVLSGFMGVNGELLTYEQEQWEDEEYQEVVQLPRDGSKKRERFHHWFIAQEVQALAEKLGVDFGGLQDHSLNGGADVMSLGYDEFIPPIVKALQEVDAKVESILARLDKLEGGDM